MASKLAIGLLLALSFFIPSAKAQAPIGSVPERPLETPEEISSYVREQDDFNHFGGEMYETLKRESAGWKNIQSLVPKASGPNGREDSWGICQIHLPDHPDVTKKEALDVRFCVQFTVNAFKTGHRSWWTYWRKLYGS